MLQPSLVTRLLCCATKNSVSAELAIRQQSPRGCTSGVGGSVRSWLAGWLAGFPPPLFAVVSVKRILKTEKKRKGFESETCLASVVELAVQWPSRFNAMQCSAVHAIQFS